MGRRIVLDTNVIVAGLRSRRGAAFRLLSLLGSGGFTHCLSVPLLFEYEDVLTRPGMVPLSAEAIEDILDGLCATAEQRPLYFLWRPQLVDAADDLILEIAVTGQCDTIITYNQRHFGGSERFGVRVQTPADFLRALHEKGEDV
ncbi:MAG: putative toxin-antitoxin system toxin component, PIN family [bacterium]